jgi:hypothetical protein
LAHQKTPTAITDKLNRASNVGLADAKMQARFAGLGGAVVAGSAADFKARVR